MYRSSMYGHLCGIYWPTANTVGGLRVVVVVVVVVSTRATRTMVALGNHGTSAAPPRVLPLRAALDITCGIWLRR